MNRMVRCVKEDAFGNEVNLPSAKCPGIAPPTEKSCNEQLCPDSDIEDSQPKGTIQAEDTLYIQKEPLDKLSLKIGGKAVVFEGTTLKVRCPRRRQEDLDNDIQRVDWFKDGKKISSSHKFYITSKQALRIKRVSRDDSGVYSCSVGGSRAQLILSVKDSNGTEITDNRSDRKKPRKLGRRRKTHRFPGVNEVLPTDDTPESSSRFFANDQQTFRNPSLGESLGTLGRPDGRANNGLQIITATNDANAASATSINTKNDILESGAVSSSASRTTSDFGHLFSGLKKSFSVPASHPQDVLSNDADDDDLTNLGSNSHRRTKSIDHKRDGLFLDGVSSSKDLLTIMGKNSVLDFSWINSPWSSCSQSCGAVGIQVRGTQCVVRSGSVTKVVDENLCHDAGLKRPEFIRDCQISCVKWMETEWSECKECIRNGFGKKLRDVKCVSFNGTAVSDDECPLTGKPVRSEECQKESCQAVWVTGPWSDVSISCLAMNPNNCSLSKLTVSCRVWSNRNPNSIDTMSMEGNL